MRSICKHLPARHLIAAITLLVTGIVLIGCIGEPQNPAATQPVTVIDPATTRPAYWLVKPAPIVSGTNFDEMWANCEAVARDFLFTLDRVDYRGGIITTMPLTSRQWFEIWRNDVQTWDDLQTNAITATRRTVYFQFSRNGDGTITVSPKVLVERQTIAEQRITSVVDYAGVFRRPLRTRDQARGTAESDLGEGIPSRYWYLTGRDPALETALADAMRKRITAKS